MKILFLICFVSSSEFSWGSCKKDEKLSLDENSAMERISHLFDSDISTFYTDPETNEDYTFSINICGKGVPKSSNYMKSVAVQQVSI